MATPVFYQTQTLVGMDPTMFYTNIPTAGASVTPELPAPPFTVGTRAFGSDGSEFIFVQASTSISLSDFVVINVGSTVTGSAANPFTANSVTTTNVQSSLAIALGATGLVLKQSVSFIPGSAMFWAQTKGAFIPAYTSSTLTNTIGATGSQQQAGTVLYTGSTAGQMTTTFASGAAAFVGFTVVNSLAVSIATSLVPPGLGQNLSNGFTVGPVVSMGNVRSVIVQSTVSGASNLVLAF